MVDLVELKQEKADLSNKIDSVVAFIESEDYLSITRAEQRMLLEQYAGMSAYMVALSKRITHYTCKESMQW